MPSRDDSATQSPLTRTGGFRDNELERRFRLEHENDDARHLAWLSAVTAVLFLSFTALDHALFGTGRLFLLLLGMRLATAVSLLGVTWHLVRMPAQASSGVRATIAESVLLMALLSVAATYPAGAFSSVEQGMTLYVLAIYFLVPGRWIFTAIVALIGTVAFVVIATLRWNTALSAWATIVVLLGFGNFIGALGSYRLNSLRRLQYHALHAFRQSNDQLRRGTGVPMGWPSRLVRCVICRSLGSILSNALSGSPL
ncbi:MAG TPA: hypothetical protein VFA48_14730 [Gammaproteobacteria bacterium]|nr:hypothetical protein [Gammaproteobacteria bacterium]